LLLSHEPNLGILSAYIASVNYVYRGSLSKNGVVNFVFVYCKGASQSRLPSIDLHLRYSPTLRSIHMVYILPQNQHDSKLTYSSTYDEILRERRLAPDSSVVLLVPPELDALCAAHILTSLFVRDDVNLRTIPVAGYPSLQSVKHELLQSASVSYDDK